MTLRDRPPPLGHLESRPAGLLDRIDGLLIDLDGVVYIGDKPITGSAEAIAELRHRGKRLVFLTNDPVGSRAEYVERLRSCGVPADVEDIVTSGHATAEFLRGEERGSVRTAFVVGSAALKEEIEGVGVQLLDDEAGAEADAVVIGGHPGFDYRELRVASQAVRKGARFYAAGRDATFPMLDGPWPATGAILAAVEVASGRQALAIGKPAPYMFEVARAIAGRDLRLAVVGDRLDADIEGGKSAGLFTILVLTGSTRADALAQAPVAPDLVIPDLIALLDAG